MKRRKFVQSALLGTPLSGNLLNRVSEKSWLHSGESIKEPARKTTISGDYDVVVAGGGPAGVTAAISAGRSGARTLLIESHGCLGGVWTSGLLTWILDQQNKQGLMKEIRNRLIHMDAKCPLNTGGIFSFDAEKMKLLLEEMCLEAYVDVLFHCRVVDGIKNDNRITHVITESKSGREAWGGKQFIDATGDGDLAARLGCSFDFGNVEGQWQPMSLLAVVGGVHFDNIEPYVRYAGDTGQQSKRRLLEQMKKGGYNPSYQKPGLYPITKDLYMLMANHEYGFKAINTREVSKATLNARKELHKIVEALNSTGGDWKKLRLIATAEQIGIREGRRIRGLYTLTKEDLINGVRFDDAVCRVSFPVDVHSTSRENEEVNTKKTGRSYSQGIKSRPYDIPLRSLIAADINGLMTAGRCISGDFIAHSSYRVTGNAVAMGESAGKVSAMAALNDKLPQEISLSEVGL